MSLFSDWNKLIEGQTQETYQAFWDEYSSTEERIYQDILAHYQEKPQGVIGDLIKKYEADPVIFMGFLDGINSSLRTELDLESLDENSEIELDIDLEKLLYNMFAAKADYLYGLKEWEAILSPEEYKRIHDEYRRSRTVRVEKKPGRNDPCPCGRGKKYKNCCGRVLTE